MMDIFEIRGAYSTGLIPSPNDAEGICEAVSRPSMRFVAVKTCEQQTILSLHRARQGFVKARTAHANQIRGLLVEYGITLAVGSSHIGRRVPTILEEGDNELPAAFGGRQVLLGISKRGDSYLRTLLTYGARAVIRAAAKKTDAAECWIWRLIDRRKTNVAAVALANKNARIVWALLAKGKDYGTNCGRAPASV